MRDIHLPGRSVVHSRHGAAATSHPLSTLTAIEILRRGGTAADAAVAACAVQGIVEPMSTGIGGDCFVLYAPAGTDTSKGGKVHGLNASGRAPSTLTADKLLKQGIGKIGLQSPHAVTVPGAIDGWNALLGKFGRMGFAEVLAPAIALAEEGFAVTPRIAVDWIRNTDKLKADANAAALYLPGGRSPKAGEVHRNPNQARVLREIATKGRDGFYTGWVAEDIVAHLRSLGGEHQVADFANSKAEWVEPITTRYRGVDVYQIPPNGQGIAMLLMLNILGGYDLSKLDPHGVERLHLETEASRIAFNARDQYVADQHFAKVPVEKLLSPAFADEARGRIRSDRAMEQTTVQAGPVYRDTIYLTVVDADRNVCSFINSLYFQFGSGLVSPKTGVLLQNRGSGFRVEPGHPNCVEPNKRPMHTIIPGMALRNGKPFVSFGVMGGDFQPVGQSHVLTNILDYGMDVQEALDSPRVFHSAGKLDCENGVSDAVMQGLAKLGHTVARPEMPWGGGQAIMLDWENGTLAAGSDPRKDGCALGY